QPFVERWQQYPKKIAIAFKCGSVVMTSSTISSLTQQATAGWRSALRLLAIWSLPISEIYAGPGVDQTLQIAESAFGSKTGEKAQCYHHVPGIHPPQWWRLSRRLAPPIRLPPIQPRQSGF